MKILVLTRELSSLDEAHTCYVNAMRELGHAVSMGTLPTLGVVDGRVVAATVAIDRPLAWHDSIAETPVLRQVDDVDLVWVLGQPRLPMMKDVWQLLWMLNQRVRFVNDVSALMFLNTKSALSLAVPSEALPFTVASDDGVMLWETYVRDSKKPWILKPTNDDSGRDVYLLEPGSSNNRALLESMTARNRQLGVASSHCVLQEFLEFDLEKRVVLAGGEPYTQYGRVKAEGDHRGNCDAGAYECVTDLSAEEHRISREVAQLLLGHGVRFAGIDLAFPKVLEVNLVNPSTTSTLVKIGQEDRTAGMIELILRALP